MSCNINIPEPQREECNGCYQETKCVVSNENNIYLGLKEGDNLNTLVLLLESKLREAFERIVELENIILDEDEIINP